MGYSISHPVRQGRVLFIVDESYKVEREATCSASLEVFFRQSKVKDVWVLCLVSSVKAVKLGLDTDSVKREGIYLKKQGK